LMIPGSIAVIEGDSCRIAHPIPEDQVQAIFAEKRAYLEAYKARKQPEIDAIRATWPGGRVDIVTALREWFEPLIQQADMTCAGIGQRVLLDCGTQAVVLDFQQRAVYAWDGEQCDYRFYMQPGIVESCIERHVEDWINDLFLSCRFEAERKGPFNEYVYNFFKCLSPERVQYAEGYYAELAPDQQLFECDGYRVQKRCPHLKADLTRFAEVEDGVLTCTLHGWQFELESGRCLTSDDAHLYTERIEERAEAGTASAAR
ncbi:MAG: Rieske 2Fe-2S domain-containing protein, partial [Chloroflexota bacterium]|nr:Rieske 2Fe-2S domain-containing protein [Chloroflexota bacterium]